jgi:DNA-binding XRE family transcriptional regulator
LILATTPAKLGYMQATAADMTRSRLRVHLDLPSPAERRRLREVSGLSQQEMADIVGVTRQAIGHWENGTRSTPRGPLLGRYVDALRALREVA